MTDKQHIQYFYIKWILKNMMKKNLIKENDLENIDRRIREHLKRGPEIRDFDKKSLTK